MSSIFGIVNLLLYLCDCVSSYFKVICKIYAIFYAYAYIYIQFCSLGRISIAFYDYSIDTSLTFQCTLHWTSLAPTKGINNQHYLQTQKYCIVTSTKDIIRLWSKSGRQHVYQKGQIRNAKNETCSKKYGTA